MQATVDRNLAEREARQKKTDEIIARRKQAADAVTSTRRKCRVCGYQEPLPGPPTIHLRDWAEDDLCLDCDTRASGVPMDDREFDQVAASETPEMRQDLEKPENQMGKHFEDQVDRGIKMFLELLDIIKRDTAARELRGIEMHNNMMDAMKEVTAQTQAAVDLFSDISNNIRDIAEALRLKE